MRTLVTVTIIPPNNYFILSCGFISNKINGKFQGTTRVRWKHPKCSALPFSFECAAKNLAVQHTTRFVRRQFPRHFGLSCVTCARSQISRHPRPAIKWQLYLILQRDQIQWAIHKQTLVHANEQNLSSKLEERYGHSVRVRSVCLKLHANYTVSCLS